MLQQKEKYNKFVDYLVKYEKLVSSKKYKGSKKSIKQLQKDYKCKPWLGTTWDCKLDPAQLEKSLGKISYNELVPCAMGENMIDLATNL